MSDLQKLTVRREDVTALEQAAEELMRLRRAEHATRVYALALRLRTEAGWDNGARRLSDAWSVQAPTNVRELRRG